MLSEIRQTEKDKYCMISLIPKMVDSKNAKLTGTESRLVVARGWVEGGGWGQMLVKGHRLPVTK